MVVRGPESTESTSAEPQYPGNVGSEGTEGPRTEPQYYQTDGSGMTWASLKKSRMSYRLHMSTITTLSHLEAGSSLHCISYPPICLYTLHCNSALSEINMGEAPRKKIIVALTGATGAAIGIHVLSTLRRLNVESHLIISKWAAETIKYETDYTPASVRALADHVYNPNDLAAPIASGSCHVDGMIVVPCSVKTLAAINAGICDDLITRAADVCLKERRRLVLSLRETPLSEIHLRNMMGVTRAGAIIAPPVVGFYTRPSSVDDILNQMVGRLLDLFGLEAGNFERWEGMANGKS
ncbi:3-octaprenyl-4-hydroxybenzoate carboxy-lyase [Fusarium pseudoanthophilum]|uniref:Flavin prenyltransferase PAD1, mitochondrial n=1 Tax=Fusarium pseudoanthophilum TaxID=48495 RepID=A0A8H5V0A5_9HYPO|nr:3-octaprenyl-4-hydroxybenzoate carboxy-lyase [Fusarium pseudoanthophilum]